MATTTLERPAATATEPRNGTHIRPAVKRLTFAEYMEIERKSETKHDLVEGIMIPVAGGTGFHNTICGNVITWLNVALLDTTCRSLTSDQKVYIGHRRGRYPDVVVVCGEMDMAFGEALRNPVLLVEVQSESTASIDFVTKFREYRSIESVRHYVLIDQYRPSLEHWARQDDGVWTLIGDYTSLDDTWRFSLSGADVAIPLAKLYRLVTFPETDPFDTDDEEETPQ